jgi:hypothetical protein
MTASKFYICTVCVGKRRFVSFPTLCNEVNELVDRLFNDAVPTSELIYKVRGS